MIDKKALIAGTIRMLEEEIISIRESIKSIEEEIRDAPSANKSHSDTTKSQKEGLLSGFTGQLIGAQSILVQLRKMSLGTVIIFHKVVVGSLVEVEGKVSKKHCFYFIVPGGAGKKVNISSLSILLISPNTPIALGLLGHRVGDDVECKLPKGIAKLKIVNIE